MKASQTSFGLLLIVCTLSLPNLLPAATLHGKIVDQHNRPIIRATIRVLSTHEGAYSGIDGNYHISGIAPGVYSIVVTCLGYKTRADIKVDIPSDSSNLTLNLSLAVAPLKGGEVVIQGRVDKQLEVSARATEKYAPNILNVVSAQTIDHSADRTSADVLQHVSGLSVEQDQGEARFVVFRGMSQRYNNTLLNGIKIPSPEPKVRFVPIDLIPSDLLERIIVTKALTPDMEGDAIGGTANLILKNAPNRPVLDLTLGSGYNNYLFNHRFTTFNRNTTAEDPALKGPGYVAQPSDFSRDNMRYTMMQAPPDGLYSLTAGSRFFDNSLGIILSGSLQNTFRRTEGTKFDLTSNPNKVDPNHIIEPTYHQQNDLTYSTNRGRLGLNAKVDYILDPTNQIDFNYSYFDLSEFEVRHTYSTVVDSSRASASITIQDRSMTETQNIATYMLEGRHQLSNELDLVWIGAYSDAKRNRPDIPEITLTQNRAPDGQIDPRISFFDVFRYWQNNDDRDKMGKVDLDYKPAGSIFTFKTGGLIRLKDRVNYDNEYTLNPDPSAGVLAQQWKGIDSVKWVVYDNSGTSQYGFNNYNATETVAAGYLESTANFGLLQVLGGARVEATHEGYTTQAPATLNATAASINYVDLLPSLHLKYEVTDQQNLRLSYTNSLSRPSYFELVPYEVRNPTTNLVSRGNYQLQRTTATNLDFRYEYYPNLVEEFTAGLFYKRIVNPIEQVFDASNAAAPYVQPRNLGTATNYGFELVATKMIGEFEASVNYTFTKSSLVSDKYIYLRYGTANAYDSLYREERPLEGQAEHVLNVSLAFSHEATGTYLELEYGLTSQRLVLVAPALGYDWYQNPVAELDFSFEQDITKHLVAYGKFNNLLNSPYEVENSFGLLLDREYYKPSFEIGVHYKL